MADVKKVDDVVDEIEAGSLKNAKREQFCRLYAEHGVGVVAYEETYGAGEQKRVSLIQSASRMLAQPEIRARVAAIRKALWGDNIIEQKEILERLSRIVRADVADLFDDQGNPRKISEIAPELREAIEAIEHRRTREPGEDGEMEAIDIRKISLVPKTPVYALIMKYHKMIGSDQPVEVKINLADALDKARKRARSRDGQGAA